jgi:hypothetical protein
LKLDRHDQLKLARSRATSKPPLAGLFAGIPQARTASSHPRGSREDWRKAAPIATRGAKSFDRQIDNIRANPFVMPAGGDNP